ncbi:MAG TPA: hypothetical protein VHB02_16455 [Acidimicrobiales bacterium]|nr:hypothetical protein [Acidimicrobiales bacterium]
MGHDPTGPAPGDDRPRPAERMRLLGTRPPDGAPARPEPRQGPKLRRTRSVAAWVLVVLAVVFVPISVVTVWAVNTVTDTDHYVETLAPLAQERVVTDFVAVDATNRLFDKLDVQGTIGDVLPKKASFLAAPLTNTLHTFVERQMKDLLRSTWFQNLWNTLNRSTHSTLVNVLTGKTTPGQRVNKVLVNLTPVLTKAIDQLDARGITVFDQVRTQVARVQSFTLQLASSKQIAQARRFFSVASDLGWAAPVAAVVLVVAAVAVAVDRRKTLLRIAVGVSLVVLLLLAGLALGRSFFLSHAADRVSPTVTGAIFDTLVRFLKTGLRWVLLVSVIVAVLLWLVGPARWPRWLRAQAARGIRWVGRRAAELGNEDNRRRASAGARRGAAWALEHASGMRLLGVVVAGIVLLFGGNLSVGGVWWTVVGLAVYLVVLELVFAWARRTAAVAAGEQVAPGAAGLVGAAAAAVLPEAVSKRARALVAGVVPGAGVPGAGVPGAGVGAPPSAPGAGGPPAPGGPLGQQHDGGAEHPGDDDDHDQGGPG